jgi:hypothetical protein
MLFVVVITSGCIPIPYPPYGQLYTVEDELDELLEKSATRQEVIQKLSEHDLQPFRYRERSLSYKVWMHTAQISFGLFEGGSEKYFELILEFDNEDRFVEYEKIVFRPYNKTEEEEILRDLANRGDEIARGQWKTTTLYRAEQGDSADQLALYYRIGDDEVDGLMWLCRSADQGNSAAMAEVARLYWRGSSAVEQDIVRAYVWYSRAAPYVVMPGEIIDAMTPGKMNQAENIIENWQPNQCERDLLSE